MKLPDYNGGSIVNLMSSIKRSFGGKHPYKELKGFPAEELKKFRNICLIVVDGLGYEFLIKNLKGTIFEDNIRGKMTSVFPPTTGSAITTFATGLAPQQHAFTGWNVFFREIGIVSAALRFEPKIGGMSFSSRGVDIKKIMKCKGFSECINAGCYLVKPDLVAKGDFTKATAGKSKVFGCSTLNSFFSRIIKTAKSDSRRKFIYGYWHEFDSIAHYKGIRSRAVKIYFSELCRNVSGLQKKLKGTGTRIIITSDHGFIDTSKEETIKLSDHPELYSCLSIPVCGDSRVAYFYVKLGSAKKFEIYAKTKLKKFCDVFKSRELVDKGFFGLYKPNPQLYDRIGDYTLIMKNNYIFKDDMTFSQKKNPKIGYHSGVSKEEMLVPLAVIDC